MAHIKNDWKAKSNRLGCILLSYGVIECKGSWRMPVLFRDITILAINHFDENRMQLVCESELFDKVKKGYLVPYYEATVTKGEGVKPKEVEWKKSILKK